MIEALLAMIVVFEILRLCLYIKDSFNASKVNRGIIEQQQRAFEFAKKQSTDWKKIRELEIKELKQLAKESDTMKQIYDEWLESKKKPITPLH